jgi:NADH-quinone oxidoreductase subunit L
VPGLSGFFSKDEILFYTFYRGHTALWALGALTALLTATYMFRLVYLTFFGSARFARSPQAAHGGGHGPGPALGGPGPHGDQSEGAHLHDAPPAMAGVLVVLAVGAVLAGYVGVPHALGGSNRIETFLEPSFHPAKYVTASVGPAHTPPATPAEARGPAGAGQHAEASAPATAAGSDAGHGESHGDPGKTKVELGLMAVSIALALAGIGIATLFFKSQPERAARVAASFPGLYRLSFNKYYVDEVYDATIVQPIRVTSERLLWRTVDAGLIDGTVNGTGAIVRGGASLLRLFQTGSVRAYAASVFIGVLFVLAYYLVR